MIAVTTPSPVDELIASIKLANNPLCHDRCPPT